MCGVCEGMCVCGVCEGMCMRVVCVLCGVYVCSVCMCTPSCLGHGSQAICCGKFSSSSLEDSPPVLCICT